MRIMVLEVMGRHAGWVALYTGIASAADWILLPEKEPEIDKMCAHLKVAHARKGVALVVASEGTELPQYKDVKQELDQFGHMLLKDRGVGADLAKLIEKNTGIETRSAVIGHMQRGGPPSLFDRILGLRVGAAASDAVAQGNYGKMMAIRGTEVLAIPLREGTSKLKLVDDKWMDFAKVFWK
jgi:6-phosphofructokinase 1